MPPDTEIVFNKCGVSDFFPQETLWWLSPLKLINHQAEAFSVLWYTHNLKDVNQVVHLLSSSSVAVWNPYREWCRHSWIQTPTTPFYCKEQGSSKGWKQARQTLCHTQVSQHWTPYCIKKHSRSFIYFNLYRANYLYLADFMPWKSICTGWEMQAITGSTETLSAQFCISNNKLL